MFIPLYDYNPLRTIKAPLVTRALIACNVIVFVTFQSGLVIDAQMASVGIFGVIPAEFHLGAGLRSEFATLPEPLTLVSYMFLHGGWIHLLGNMLFLWIFGNNVEDAMGRIKFIVFYFLAGFAATALQTLVTLTTGPADDATIPFLGASGAISGVLGAYFVLLPRASVLTLVFLFVPMMIPAWVFLVIWFGFQLISSSASLQHPESGGGVAFFAHIGGFVFGLLAVRLFKTRTWAAP